MYEARKRKFAGFLHCAVNTALGACLPCYGASTMAPSRGQRQQHRQDRGGQRYRHRKPPSMGGKEMESVRKVGH